MQIPRLINHSEVDPSSVGGDGQREGEDSAPSFADGDGLAANTGDYDVSLNDVAALHIRPRAVEPQIAVDYPEMMLLDQGSPLDIKNALIVDKTTRYEMERAHYNCEGEELKRELTLRGMVWTQALSLFVYKHVSHVTGIRKSQEIVQCTCPRER